VAVDCLSEAAFYGQGTIWLTKIISQSRLFYYCDPLSPDGILALGISDPDLPEGSDVRSLNSRIVRGELGMMVASFGSRGAESRKRRAVPDAF
jgi:hypothetical protein